MAVDIVNSIFDCRTWVSAFIALATSRSLAANNFTVIQLFLLHLAGTLSVVRSCIARVLPRPHLGLVCVCCHWGLADRLLLFTNSLTLPQTACRLDIECLRAFPALRLLDNTFRDMMLRAMLAAVEGNCRVGLHSRRVIASTPGK